MSFSLQMALRYLWGRKLRTVLTTLSVVFGVMIIFGMNGFLPGVMESFNRSIATTLQQSDLTITSQSRGVFDEGTVGEVAAEAGIQAATGSLVRALLLPEEMQLATQAGEPVGNLVVNGIDPASFPAVHALDIVAGQALSSTGSGMVLISEALADKAGLQPDSILRLPSVNGQLPLRVAGVYASQPSPGSENIYLGLTDAQSLFGLEGQINLIEARFKAGTDGQSARNAVLLRLGDGFKAGGNESGSEFSSAVQIGMMMMNLFGVMALVMGGFIIFNTFRTVVSERRRDIGMLRALGASRRTVIGLFLVESGVQGVIGTLAGLAAGYLMVVGLNAVVSPVARELWQLDLAQPAFPVRIFLTPVVLGIGVTVLGGLQPALTATRITPLEALRPILPASERVTSRNKAIAGLVLIALAAAGLLSGNTGLVSLGAVVFMIGLVLVGGLLVRPIATVFGGLLQMIYAREGQIARGNLIRQPGRANVTASAMMISFAVLVAMASLVASALISVTNYVEKSLSADYLVMPQSQVLGGANIGATSDMARQIGDTEGIAAVTSLRLAATQAEGIDLQVIGIDPASYPQLSGLVFAAGDEQLAYRDVGGGRAFIANGLFTSQAGLQPGDMAVFQTPDGPREYRLAGIATDYLNAKLATAYISQANLAADFKISTDVMVMADRAEGTDSEQVQAALNEVIASYPAYSVFSAEDWRERMVGSLVARMGTSYILMILLGIPSLIALVNTLGINIIERTRELGLLRAVGATRRQVKRMITAESLLLSAAGTAFGILAGLGMGYAVILGLNSGGFVLDYIFPFQGILAVIAAGLLFGVTGALIPARQAVRMNLIAALRYE